MVHLGRFPTCGPLREIHLGAHMQVVHLGRFPTCDPLREVSHG